MVECGPVPSGRAFASGAARAGLWAAGVLDATVAELETRIWKPKFDRYLSMEARQGTLHDARALAHWVDVSADMAAQRFSRDGDDDMFIQTALAGSAPWLVTSDQDLLVIEVDLGLRIVAPAQALLMDMFCK